MSTITHSLNCSAPGDTPTIVQDLPLFFLQSIAECCRLPQGLCSCWAESFDRRRGRGNEKETTYTGFFVLLFFSAASPHPTPTLSMWNSCSNGRQALLNWHPVPLISFSRSVHRPLFWQLHSGEEVVWKKPAPRDHARFFVTPAQQEPVCPIPCSSRLVGLCPVCFKSQHRKLPAAANRL